MSIKTVANEHRPRHSLLRPIANVDFRTPMGERQGCQNVFGRAGITAGTTIHAPFRMPSNASAMVTASQKAKHFHRLPNSFEPNDRRRNAWNARRLHSATAAGGQIQMGDRSQSGVTF